MEREGGPETLLWATVQAGNRCPEGLGILSPGKDGGIRQRLEWDCSSRWKKHEYSANYPFNEATHLSSLLPTLQIKGKSMTLSKQ
jgi:hypothetical protein